MSTTYTFSGTVTGLTGLSLVPDGLRGCIETYGKGRVGTSGDEDAHLILGRVSVSFAADGSFSVADLPATGSGQGWSPDVQAHRLVVEWIDPYSKKQDGFATDYFELTDDTDLADVATWVESQVQSAAYWAGVAQAAAESIGSPNTLSIGTVDQGDEADASITGTSPNQVLNLTLPKGDPGDPGDTGATGPANELTIGTVTGGETADATITGTAPEQVLNLVLPQGEKGDTGDEGPQGPPGDGSVNSVNGDPGPDVVLDYSDVGAASAAQGALADSATQPGDLATVATTGAYADLSGKPTLATVATSGDYDDLTDKPTLGTAAAAATGDFAASTGGGREKVLQMTGTTGTVTGNLNNASIFYVTPTGNITLSFSNVPGAGNGVTVTVHVLQGATPRTVTLPSGAEWYQPGAPTMVANKTCTITLHTVNGGTSWFASYGIVS